MKYRPRTEVYLVPRKNLEGLHLNHQPPTPALDDRQYCLHDPRTMRTSERIHTRNFIKYICPSLFLYREEMRPIFCCEFRFEVSPVKFFKLTFDIFGMYETRNPKSLHHQIFRTREKTHKYRTHALFISHY